jgi:hypothetical protein
MMTVAIMFVLSGVASTNELNDAARIIGFGCVRSITRAVMALFLHGDACRHPSSFYRRTRLRCTRYIYIALQRCYVKSDKCTAQCS